MNAHLFQYPNSWNSIECFKYSPPFSQTLFQILPSYAPSPRAPHSTRREKVQSMGLHYGWGDAILPSVFSLLFTLHWKMKWGGTNDGFILPAMQAIRFAENEFKGRKSKHYNFDVGEFIRCRRFLSGWSLFNILGCAVCVYCAARAHKQPHLPSIKTLTAESNNPHIWTWTLGTPHNRFWAHHVFTETLHSNVRVCMLVITVLYLWS